MLRVEGLRKQMPGFSIETSFQAQANDRIAIVGRSGSGKTTLLRIIAGLESLNPKKDSGRIYLGEREITRLPPQKRRVGFVFQEQALFSGRSVFENVEFGLKMQKVPRETRDRQVKDWLSKVGLERKSQESVDHLSGGERQRVALARALITRPEILLMDEPFVGLDGKLREALIGEILKLHAEYPIPLLFISHEEGETARLATRFLVLEESAGGNTRRFVGT